MLLVIFPRVCRSWLRRSLISELLDQPNADIDLRTFYPMFRINRVGTISLQ
jgi:hypothetical protein